MTKLTERQLIGWPDAVARLNGMGANVSVNIGAWDVCYSDETRTGRGHFINAQYNDGEVYAQILMDVYGYPSVSLASLDWVHADSNEECDCDACEAERAEEEA